MTNNMKKMKFEVARAIITCFPKDYIKMVFIGGVSEKEKASIKVLCSIWCR